MLRHFEDGADAFDGDRLAGTPEQQGTLLLDYQRPLANGWTFNANYSLTAVSDVYTKVGLRNNGEVLPGYAIHGAAVGLSSGTDALRLGLQAVGVRAGDEVILPAISFFASAEAVLQLTFTFSAFE